MADMEAAVEQALGRFVEAAREALGDDLSSVVLFGSAAEDRLRPSSDVNVVLVLRRYDPDALDRLRPELAVASAAVQLRPMFLVEDELADAADAFAVKLDDIRRRHRVLHGSDPFAALEVPRAAVKARLRQVLLNLLLRMRGTLASVGDREEQLVRTIADFAGPLRACAAELLELESGATGSPREALERVAGRPLPEISQARETGRLPPGEARRVLLDLMAICAQMRERVEELS
jgi:predicted nucleotidyltransferase